MAHYDLYNALGLDRSMDTNAIASDLDQRIASGHATNSGGMEELKIARKILGDSGRRDLYDKKLNDPSAPDIDVAALRDLANANIPSSGGGAHAAPAAGGSTSYSAPQSQQASSAPFGQGGQSGQSNQFSQPQFGQQAQGQQTQFGQQPQGQAQPGQPQQGQPGQYGQFGQQQGNAGPKKPNETLEKAKSEISRSSKSVIAGTALATLLVVALIFGLVQLFSWVGNDERKVASAAKEFLKLEDDNETESWLRDNGWKESRDSIEKTLDLDGDFDGVADWFDVNDAKVGDVIDEKEIYLIGFKGDEKRYKDELKSEGLSGVYAVKVVNKSGDDTGGRLEFVIEDGKAKLFNVITDMAEFEADSHLK